MSDDINRAELLADVWGRCDRLEKRMAEFLIAHINRDGMPRTDDEWQELITRAAIGSSVFEARRFNIRNYILQEAGFNPETI